MLREQKKKLIKFKSKCLSSISAMYAVERSSQLGFNIGLLLLHSVWHHSLHVRMSSLCTHARSVCTLLYPATSFIYAAGKQQVLLNKKRVSIKRVCWSYSSTRVSDTQHGRRCFPEKAQLSRKPLVAALARLSLVLDCSRGRQRRQPRRRISSEALL